VTQLKALIDNWILIAQGLLASFTLGVGQFCTKPGLVFVQQSAEAQAFLKTLTDIVTAASCGTMLTPDIRDAFLANRTKITRTSGVHALAESAAAPAAVKTEGQPSVATTTAARFVTAPELATEAFGPFTLVVLCETNAEMLDCVRSLEGQLTATIHGTAGDLAGAQPLVAELEQRAGRLVFNSFPTGVEVSPAMNHGGPYPATTDSRFTSVGTAAILRFARPVCYQGWPDAALPAPLTNANPLGILRLVNGTYTRDPSN